MASAENSSSALMLARFGLGARPGDLVASGPALRDAMLAEITPSTLMLPPDPDLPEATDALSELGEFRSAVRKRREVVATMAQPTMAQPSMAGENVMNSTTTPPGAKGKPAMGGREPAYPQRVFRAEAQARLANALVAPLGFGERWVWFWGNHFCVSAAKGQSLRVLAGNYERTVIRAHGFGRFGEMLLASARHPAMLIYLDNRQSIGPNSRAGTRRGRGLNENLAREILELHTLGVNGGYTQADVTRFAKILTGWTVIGPNDDAGEIGEFNFNPNRHEPGEQSLLGTRFAQADARQGEAALAMLASHPATAKHIALKLARHFVADAPPPALVARLEKAFLASGGDLAALARTLLSSPEALEAPASKMRSPQEFVVAGLRAMRAKPNLGQWLGPLNALGQPLWQPAGPNGFPDDAAHWANPEGMKVRLEVAAGLARAAGGSQNPSEALDAVLGARASAMTREAVARAESRPQGLALLMMAPEFQRR